MFIIAYNWFQVTYTVLMALDGLGSSVGSALDTGDGLGSGVGRATLVSFLFVVVETLLIVDSLCTGNSFEMGTGFVMHFIDSPVMNGSWACGPVMGIIHSVL